MKNPNQDRLDYIGQNKDWEFFTKFVSDNTGEFYRKWWVENLSNNRQRCKERGWAAQDLQGLFQGKTAVMLGASPAIMNQLHILRNLQYDPDFVMVGITSGIRNLIQNNIHPRYVMIADADPAMKRFWDGMDMSKTKTITLIANICTHPDLLDMWQGPIKFIALWTDDKKLDGKIQKKYAPVNGTGAMFPTLGSQYNLGTAFAFLVLECPVIIFVGNELSFPTEEAPYYPDRKDKKDGFKRKKCLDIYGYTVWTNYMFMSLKLGLEDLLGKWSGAGWFLNCTEAGIFGISSRYGGYLPWIQQLKLKTGIAQARHIMKYGVPMYDIPAIKDKEITTHV